jgi:hypothetical protein
MPMQPNPSHQPAAAARWIWFAIAWFFAATPAAADIYKCADKSGMDRYQNFPCAIDSIGSLQSGPPPASTQSPRGGVDRTAPTAMPVAVASAGRSAGVSEPGIGMTEDEVRAIWGEPEEMLQDEPRDGRIEIWRYGDGRFVQFSNKHRVLVVQR